jgi:O-antigen/teichoic acid export membrane protein
MESSSLRQVGTEGFWVALGQAVAALGAIVGVRLLTAFMNPTAYGELALALTIGMLSQQFILGPLSQPLGRFFAPKQESNQLSVYFRAGLVLLTQGSAAVLFFAVLSIAGVWVTGQVRWIPVVLLAFLLALVNGYEGGLDAIQNAARHRIVVAWHDGLGQWARFGMAILLIVFLESSGTVALMGYALGGVVVLVSQVVFLKMLLLKGIPWAANQVDINNCVRQMHAFAWPFAGWGLFTWAQVASDRWALQVFGATGVVGLYAALFQVGYAPIYFLTGLGVQLFSPILFGWAGDASDPGRLKRAFRLNHLLLAGALALTTAGTLLAFRLHNQIFRLVVAPQ